MKGIAHSAPENRYVWNGGVSSTSSPLCASPGINWKFELILTVAVELEQILQVIPESHKASLYLRLLQSLSSLLVLLAYK